MKPGRFVRALALFAVLLCLPCAARGESGGSDKIGKEIMNVLLCGVSRDENGTRGGAVMVLSADTRRGGVWLTFVNGDILVDYGGRRDRLSSFYASDGADGMAGALSVLLDVGIKSYLTVDMEGFSAAVDTFGGVDLTLTEEEAAGVSDMCGEETIAGRVTLSGRQALAYVSLRVGGSTPANERRRAFLSAMVDKTLKNPDLGRLLDVADRILPYMQTNLSAGDMIAIAFAYLAGGGWKMETCSIPGGGEGRSAENGGIELTDDHAAAERFRRFILNGDK